MYEITVVPLGYMVEQWLKEEINTDTIIACISITISITFA